MATSDFSSFAAPIRPANVGNGWDFHIYFKLEELETALALHQQVRETFPTLKLFKVWDKPIGPHTLPMFEVDVFTPAEFGAFLSWIAVNRQGFSVLAHPHTGDDVTDHLVHGVWIGDKVPLIRERLE
ncbi:DOPA-like domain-containing protein [Chytriomyces sp. MP71]|nr:DOPA-like domain-containing protein [Chytriomyces sp. MP71]